jgi:Domain of unknown function (DUF4270)
MRTLKKKEFVFLLLLVSLLGQSCYRNDIQFGDNPENNYTRIVFVDSVAPVLSTVITDSFVTNNAQSFLLGKYKDPYLGIISAKPFFQMDIPTPLPDIPITAQYDSIVFLMRLNKYYYADTSRPQTIHVNELYQTIDYTYNNRLYNTSNIPVMPVELGSLTLRLRPSVDSVIALRLNDTKGIELFNKLAEGSADITRDDVFLNYFKGISLSVSNNDTTAIYGLDGGSARQVMRIYYHTTVPGLENKSIDFTSNANSFAFNQIITDRRGTSLYSSTGQKEFAASQTNNLAFTQYGTGTLLKITFPTLKSILRTNDIVRLKKAELIIKPEGQSFDPFIYKLPSTLFLAQTDGSNIIGASVLDSTSSSVEYISPSIDEIYGLNTNYRFDVTSSLNQILTNSGTDDHGYFLLQNITGASPQVDRAVIASALNKTYKTQLLLTIVIIDK